MEEEDRELALDRTDNDGEIRSVDGDDEEGEDEERLGGIDDIGFTKLADKDVFVKDDEDKNRALARRDDVGGLKFVDGCDDEEVLRR